MGRILDQDGNNNVLFINDVTMDEGTNSLTTFNFRVSLVKTSPLFDVTFTANTADGTATAGTDYNAVSELTVTIRAGDVNVDVPVEVIADAIDEPDRTFFVDIGSPGPSSVSILDARAVGTIEDDVIRIKKAVISITSIPQRPILCATLAQIVIMNTGTSQTTISTPRFRITPAWNKKITTTTR